MSNVVIVGAGLCGLSAAVSLLERGIRPIIIEKSGMVGGLARSIKIGDQVFDIGVHIMYRPAPIEVQHLLNLSSVKLFKRKSNSAINIDSMKISIIAELKNFIKYPSELKRYLIRKYRLSPGEAFTLKERLISQYGEWLYERFFENYIRKKIPGFSGVNIHSDWWGLGNVRNEFNVFSKGKGSAKSGIYDKISSRIKWWTGFFLGHKNIAIYPEGGTGEIAKKLGSFVLTKGARLEHETTVIQIVHEKGRIERVKLSNGDTIDCNNLIWTGMLPDLVELLGLEWPEELTYISTMLVCLVFERKNVQKRKYLFEYSADMNVIFQRFYYNDFFGSIGRRFGICAEISRDDNMECVEEEIVSKTIEGLKHLGAIGDERMIDYKVVREYQSHPLYILNYRKVLADLFADIYDVDGVFPVGRSGAFNNLRMQATMKLGWDIAQHCAERLGKMADTKI